MYFYFGRILDAGLLFVFKHFHSFVLAPTFTKVKGQSSLLPLWLNYNIKCYQHPKR